MTTYYMRDGSGQIYNATESDLSEIELSIEFPLPFGCRYDAHPPLDVLQRYRYWNERP